MKSILGPVWTSCSRTTVPAARRNVSTSSSAWYKVQAAPPLEVRNPGALRFGLENESPTQRGRPVGHQTNRNYKLFEALVSTRFTQLLDRMGRWKSTHDEYRSFGINSQSDLDKESGLFRKALSKSFALASKAGMTGRNDNPLFWNLRNAFVKSDASGLSRELKYAFQTFILRNRFPEAISDVHAKLADLRHPYEWFPATRMMQRTVHLHVGPTNSGKTYNALKALEHAKSGIYAGPLRLLAHEIYTRFQAKGLPCALVTGEEQRIPEDSDRFFQSCTVEMAPLNRQVDVAVVDEIQMIADDERGWAWTQAFLGLQAKELHLCGEERAVELIQTLSARLGDKVVIHRYKRLNPLQTMHQSLEGDFSNLRKGDAVVSFSRVGLHSLKAGIEEETGRRCAIVYGSLPPETRVQQAALFNEPDNEYDFLVASDAIGMGLNLEIKRVIFESAQKFDGIIHRNLTIPEVKQIGGRAGRFSSAKKDNQTGNSTSHVTQTSTFGSVSWGTPGLVTTLDEEDLPLVKESFENEAEPLKTAGLMPPAFVMERFSNYFPPNTPFSFVLSRLRELSRLSGSFHMCNFAEMVEIADNIQEFSMSVADRLVFLAAPVDLRNPKSVKVLKAFARCVSEMESGHILDIKEIDLEILEINLENSSMTPSQYLLKLEDLHKAIMLYMWLTYRFEGAFPSRHLAFHIKSLVEDKITAYLEGLTFEQDARQRRLKAVRSIARQHSRDQEKLAAGEDIEIRKGKGRRKQVHGETQSSLDENTLETAEHAGVTLPEPSDPVSESARA